MDLNLQQKMTDQEKTDLARGAILADDTGALVEMADRTFSVITPETAEDAKKWRVDLGQSILIINPSYRMIAGVNPAGRFGKDMFTFVLDDTGGVDTSVPKNAQVKGILYSVLRCFFGGKGNMPDLDPVHILVNDFELIRGLQARVDIGGGVAASGTAYNNWKKWKVAS